MTQVTIARLKDLLRVGEALLAEPRTNTLGFGKWDCGSYACFAGHYERTMAVGLDLRTVSCQAALRMLVEHFEITPEEAHALFRATSRLERAAGSAVEFSFIEGEADVPGPAAYRELEKRLMILRTTIARFEQSERRAVSDAALADVRSSPSYISELFLEAA